MGVVTGVCWSKAELRRLGGGADTADGVVGEEEDPAN